MAKDDLENQLDKLTGAVKADEKAEKKRIPKVEVPESLELSVEEKATIESEVAAEIAKELKAEKRREFKAATKQRLKKQTLFRHGKDEEGEDTELVLITLASHTPCLTIDGTKYYPGRAYRMNSKLASVVKEQMYRGELHDNEIHGKKMSEFFGQRPRGLKISPNSPLPSELN